MVFHNPHFQGLLTWWGKGGPSNWDWFCRSCKYHVVLFIPTIFFFEGDQWRAGCQDHRKCKLKNETWRHWDNFWGHSTGNNKAWLSKEVIFFIYKSRLMVMSYLQALRERCEELEKEKLELGCGVKARESEASRFISWHSFSNCIPIFSEVAALRDEKVEAERRVEAGLKNLHQKEERITLLQVKLA